MGWVEALHGQLVGLDTAPLIYFIERHPTYRPKVRPFFQALADGKLRVVTPNITLLEVLVHPYRHNNQALQRQYRDILLHATGLRMIPLSHTIADEAAKLRAEHNLLAADAIQIATTLLAGASAFLTNDRHFPALANLQLLIVDDL